MGSLGFTLADRLGARSNPCTVKGCTRTWLQMTGRVAKLGGRANANDGDPTSGMCEPCREAFPKLANELRACDRPGCEHYWTWTVGEQIEAFATRRPPPHRLCDDCQGRLAALSDREIPCSVPGCQRHAIFTKQAQLLAAAAPGSDVEAAPVMMCGPCANVYEKIKDRPVTCGIQGCKQKWSWTRDEQIKDYAAGLPNEPPRRLCESCKGVFGGIADREVRCRTSGCKHTWTWLRETQLNSAVAGKPVPKAPHRMCQRCIDLYSGMKDVERPCRRPGCKRSWTDKRGAQLARAVRGKTGDPYPHYCAECEKELGEMEDRQVPCKTEHCPGTWTWTAAQQLAAGVRPDVKHEASGPTGAAGAHEVEGDGDGDGPSGISASSASAAGGGADDDSLPPGSPAQPVVEVVTLSSGATPQRLDDAASASSSSSSSSPTSIEAATAGTADAGPSGGGRKRRRRRRRKEIRPPDRRCEDCVTFLKDRKTKEVPCVGCKTTIFWPPESQLQTHLGNWAEPTLCGACKRDLTEAARAAERESLRHGGPSHPVPLAPTESAGPSEGVGADGVGGGLQPPPDEAPPHVAESSVVAADAALN